MTICTESKTPFLVLLPWSTSPLLSPQSLRPQKVPRKAGRVLSVTSPPYNVDSNYKEQREEFWEPNEMRELKQKPDKITQQIQTRQFSVSGDCGAERGKVVRLCRWPRLSEETEGTQRCHGFREGTCYVIILHFNSDHECLGVPSGKSLHTKWRVTYVWSMVQISHLGIERELL